MESGIIEGVLTGHPLNWLNCTVLSSHIPYYILDLLQLTSSVYVEGLGRFEAIFHSAKVDATKTSIEPPHIEGAFQPDVDTPNETLEAFIRYTSGDQAGSPKEAIAAFVRNVHQQTEDGQPLLIEHFGTFTKNDQGVLRFTPDWDAFNISFRGLEAVELSAAAEPEQKILPLTPPPPYIPKSPAPETSEKDGVQDDEAALASIAGVDYSKEEFEKNLDKIDPSNSRLWWVMLITAIVLIAMLCVYLVWDIMNNRVRLKELQHTYPDTTLTTPIEPAPDTTLAQPDQPIVDEPVVVTPPVVDEPPCYIVVGAFGDPGNVTRMVERLQAMQYTVEELQGRRLTKVAVRTSCDPDNLQQVLNEVRSSVNPEAWIY